jgi:hypothetical protein
VQLLLVAPAMRSSSFGVLLPFLVAACGNDDPTTGIDPTDVRFGDTALVVVVNPAVNDANRDPLPEPGTTRGGIVLTSDDGIADTTDADGIAVLAPLTAGTRTISVSSGGSFTVVIADGELRELALAADATGAEVMLEIDYKTDDVVELSPAMPSGEIAAALAVSDRVVFLAGGVYVGDLDFSGSRVTLFGEGVLGGTVTLDGNVTMSGSDSRIRGAHIIGDLSIPASGTGLSFSRVDGNFDATGSDTTLLANELCGGDAITGSGSIVVGNAGAAPLAACP